MVFAVLSMTTVWSQSPSPTQSPSQSDADSYLFQVVAPGGQGVAGAEVAVYRSMGSLCPYDVWVVPHEAPIAVLTSDEQGLVDIGGLDDACRHLVARHGDYCGTSWSYVMYRRRPRTDDPSLRRSIPARKPIVIELARGREIDVVVHDLHGRPVEGMAVFVRGLGLWSAGWSCVRSEDDEWFGVVIGRTNAMGRCRFFLPEEALRQAPSGVAQVGVIPAGTAATWRDVKWSDAAGRTVELTVDRPMVSAVINVVGTRALSPRLLSFGADATVSWSIVEPLSDAGFRVTGPGPVRRKVTLTDDPVVVAGFEPGQSIRFVVQDRGHEKVERVVALPKDMTTTQVTLRVGPALPRVRFHLVDGEGQPIPRGIVRVSPEYGAPGPSNLWSVGPHHASLLMFHDARRTRASRRRRPVRPLRTSSIPALSHGVEHDLGAVVVELPPPPPRLLTGHVVDRSGRPVVAPVGVEHRDETGVLTVKFDVRTDAIGRFDIFDHAESAQGWSVCLHPRAGVRRGMAFEPGASVVLVDDTPIPPRLVGRVRVCRFDWIGRLDVHFETKSGGSRPIDLGNGGFINGWYGHKPLGQGDVVVRLAGFEVARVPDVALNAGSVVAPAELSDLVVGHDFHEVSVTVRGAVDTSEVDFEFEFESDPPTQSRANSPTTTSGNRATHDFVHKTTYELLIPNRVVESMTLRSRHFGTIRVASPRFPVTVDALVSRDGRRR